MLRVWRNINHRVRLLLASLLLVAGLGGTLIATAGTADASICWRWGGCHSIVWNHTGGSVPFYYGTRTWSGISSWEQESSQVQMICWTDDQWTNFNYQTNRWFYVQDWNGDYGWVPASYVYYQTAVPHC